MKMKVYEKVRGCYVNGATVNLNFEWETEHKTLFGGLASVLLKALIVGFYFMKRLQCVSMTTQPSAATKCSKTGV